DPDAAALFYEAVIGHRADGIVPLPPGLAARGVPPNWLGYIGVGSGIDDIAERWLARGAMRLGPPGAEVFLRDAGGAVVALTGEAGSPESRVAWHHLNTADEMGAAGTYGELFGWAFDQEGRFAFQDGERQAG